MLFRSDPATGEAYPQSGNQTYTEEVWQDAFDDTWEFNDYWERSKPAWNVGDTRSRNGHTYIITSRNRTSGWGQTYYEYTAVCHEEGHYETVERTVYSYNFYYDRASYDITYYYVNKNSQRIQTDKKEDILFEADISGSKIGRAHV